MKTRAALGVVRFDKFEVDPRTQELRRNGLPIRLPRQSFRILILLLENPRELVTRETLKKELWSEDTFVDFDRGLNAAVNRLREALGDSADQPKLIETLPRRGYRFIGVANPVVRLGDDAAPDERPLVELKPLVKPGESIHAVLAFDLNPRRKSLHLGVLVVLGVVLLAGIGIFLSQVFPTPPQIVATRQLTHTRLQKSPDMDCYLATDGSRVYFTEHRSGDSWIASEVSVFGGEASDLPAQPPRPCIYGSWQSGSELLAASCCPNKLWAVPLPTGAHRPLDIPSGARWFAPIPDASGVVYALNHDSEMHRLTLPDNTHTRLLADRDVTWARVSPDGRRIRWTSAGSDMWEMGIDGSNPHPLSFPGGSHFGDWTSDGKLFFFLRWEKNGTTLWAKREESRFSLIKSKPVLLYAGPLELHSPLASTNSKELYAIGVDLRGELSVFDPRSSRFVPFLGGISASYVTFSHDGKWIAYVSYPDGSLWRSRVDGSEKLQLTSKMLVLTPRWSPDDKLIAFDESVFEFRSIYVISPQGGKPSLLYSGPERPADPTWSPDGGSIAYGGDFYSKPPSRIRILDLKAMQSRDVPGSEGLFSPRWSPDGRYIVAHRTDTDHPELLLYDLAEQKWRSLMKGEWVGWEAWSHDNRYVYAFSATKNRIFRVETKTGKIEPVVSLEGVSWTTSGFRNTGWFDLTPDDQIMILRNTGTEEIYALRLEY